MNDRFLIVGNGYWGIGSSVGEAIRNAKWLRKGVSASLASCPEGTRVDETGRIYTPTGTHLGDFISGEIGGSANKPTFIAS